MGSRYRMEEIRERLARCDECGGILKQTLWPVLYQGQELGMWKHIHCPACDERRRAAALGEEAHQ